VIPLYNTTICMHIYLIWTRKEAMHVCMCYPLLDITLWLLYYSMKRHQERKDARSIYKIYYLNQTKISCTANIHKQQVSSTKMHNQIFIALLVERWLDSCLRHTHTHTQAIYISDQGQPTASKHQQKFSLRFSTNSSQQNNFLTHELDHLIYHTWAAAEKFILLARIN
jgi:hypothetical protein